MNSDYFLNELDINDEVREIFFKHYIHAAITFYNKDNIWMQQNIYDYLNDPDCFVEEQSIYCSYWQEEDDNKNRMWSYAYKRTAEECSKLITLVRGLIKSVKGDIMKWSQ